MIPPTTEFWNMLLPPMPAISSPGTKIFSTLNPTDQSRSLPREIFFPHSDEKTKADRSRSRSNNLTSTDAGRQGVAAYSSAEEFIRDLRTRAKRLRKEKKL